MTTTSPKKSNNSSSKSPVIETMCGFKKVGTLELLDLPPEILDSILKKAGFSNLLSVSKLFKEIDYNRSKHDFTKLQKKYPYKNQIQYCVLAAKERNIGAIKYLLREFKHRNILNFLIGGAAKGCHKDLIDLFLAIKYKNRESFDWNYYMALSVEGGNKNIINFFIDKGNESSVQIDWQSGIIRAAKCGYLNLVKFFMKKCDENRIQINLDRAMQWALEGGHIRIVRYFLTLNPFINMQHSVYFAAHSGNKKLVDFILKKTNMDEFTINNGLVGASQSGNEQLVNFFINKGEGFRLDYNLAFIEAANFGHLHLIKKFLSTPLVGYETVLNTLDFITEQRPEFTHIIKYLERL